jgi:uncharacterized protein (TIGR02147 family)
MAAPISVFAFSSYRAFIRAWIESRGQERGILTQMCEAAECQNAHMTRVLKEQVHLTLDQAFRLSRFLGLNRSESKYFMKLTEHDRAGDPDYRKQLEEEMSALKRAQENFGKRHQLESLSDPKKEALYYSSWHWVAIHYILGIPKYNTPKKIADRLSLTESFVRNSLQVLLEFGLAKRNGDTWSLNSGSIHLPKTSPMNSVQHGNWRTRAVLKSQDTTDNGLHYTTVQAISVEAFEQLKQQLLKSVDEFRKVADPSDSEELICFTLDFFKV